MIRNAVVKIGLIGVMVGLMSGCSLRSEKAEPTRAEIGDAGNYREIRVGDLSLYVEVADEAQTITKGLGYRDELGSDGMLFVHQVPHVPAYWMKGMRFGLDIVWIDCESVGLENVGECEVVDITANIPAPDDPENPKGVYQPRSGVEISHVLEVAQGWARENGLKVGDRVEL